MTWRPSGEQSAVYFASATWGGIAYFTPPLRSANALGDEAEITVFDTTSRAFPISVKGRHLIIGKADSVDKRTVIEVFELSNDSVRTLISSQSASPVPTWSVAIPQAAEDVRVTQGEISPEAFAHVSGRVSVFAPIAPGVKQVAFSYKLSTSSFPIQVRAEHGAVVFEVLIEEPQGAVYGGNFAAVDPVALESRNFRRFLAQDVQDGVITTIELPAARTIGRNVYITALLAAIGFLMFAVLMRAMQRRGRAGVEQVSVVRLRGDVGASAPWQTSGAARNRDAPMHERLAQEISALDATYARHAQPTDSMQRAYQERRAELKEALADALASVAGAR